MDTVALQAKERTKIGKRHPKRLRRKDIIPGIVYGYGTAPLPVQVDRGELEHAFHTSAGGNVLIDLKFQEATDKDVTVIIKDVQHNIVTDKVEHVDFNIISLSEKITVKVHIHPKGEAAGAEEGGILDVSLRDIKIECLPTKIPNRIDIDVTPLTIGDSIQVKDLILPEGVVCLEDPNASVIVVLAPKLEEVEAAPVEGEEAITEPEVIKKGKEEPAEGEAEATEQKA